MQTVGKKLLTIYETLKRHRGFLDWWPAESEFEVMIGAILTQNTSWTNAEAAISNLKSAKLLSYKGLLKVENKVLAGLIRPSGYYNQKTIKLKNFIEFMKNEFNGSILRMKSLRAGSMRGKLLEVKGIGPETADSILLYALGKKVFVVDAYTRRIFERIGLIRSGLSYGEVQKFFMDNLPKRLVLYNDYHAQIVIHAKEICRKRPDCRSCPIRQICRYVG